MPVHQQLQNFYIPSWTSNMSLPLNTVALTYTHTTKCSQILSFRLKFTVEHLDCLSVSLLTICPKDECYEQQ